MPANNFKEFIAYAKANQEKMQYGSAGAGSATHLGCVVLDSAMGTKITHIPYKGTGPALVELLGDDPRDDRADRGPADVQQPRDRGLGHLLGQPRDDVLEVAGVGSVR